MDPTETIPRVVEYRLSLRVDFATLRFRGHVDADLTDAVDPVVLNASGLEISAVTAGGAPVPFSVRPSAEELEVRLRGPGAVTVGIDFSGRASESSLIGLYRSSFGSEYLLTTQCAPIGARQVFPCLDRPDRKAPIRFSLTVSDGLEAIFNTPVESTVVADGLRSLTFAPTPPMPTYLFYLGIGRFDCLRGPDGRVRISVFAPPGRAGSGALALDYAGRLLAEYERYFGIDYPLPKLDLIAVPQYAYGAMENWGAIVFRDMYLLLDGSTATRTKHYGLDTISHEIAHQWFGNLVTMQWWDDIWLNESFATFLEMRMLDRVDPAVRSLDDYLGYWMPLALQGDALPHTHPVTTRVDHPSQIAQLFDEISYGKGSAILRMVEAFLGEETFRRGVGDFLDRFRYRNARSQDLWAALDRHAAHPVRPLLEVWTERPGHPLLSVTREPGHLVVRQRRFALNGRHAEETWPIPLTFEVNGKILQRELRQPVERIPVPELTSYHLNPGAVGFYRVLYDPAGYDQLLAAGPSRSATDRWIVLHDLDSFVSSGDASIDRYAAFARAERDASDHLPVRQVADDVLGLWLAIGDAESTRGFSREFLAHQLDRLGPVRRANEPEHQGILRESVAAASAWCLPDGARRLVEAHPDLTRIDADLRGAVSTAMARTGDAATYAALRRAIDGANEGEALDYERALAAFRDPALVAETLDLVRRRELNRAHLPNIVRQAAWNPEGRDVLWEWMTQHLGSIATETRGTGFASYVLEYALPYVGLGRESAVRDWVSSREIPEGGRGARKGLGLLEVTAGLRERIS